MNTVPKIPVPVNEPVLSHAPGTPERAELKRALKDLSARPIEIPLVIGGKEVRTGKTTDAVMPHCHRHVLAKVHQAGPPGAPWPARDGGSGASRHRSSSLCAPPCRQSPAESRWGGRTGL